MEDEGKWVEFSAPGDWGFWTLMWNLYRLFRMLGKNQHLVDDWFIGVHIIEEGEDVE